MSKINKNTLLLNTFFDKEADQFFVVWKDVETGDKWFNKYDKPKIPTYILKKDLPTPEYYLECAALNDLDRADVSYKWREYDLARKLGLQAFSEQVRARLIKRTDVFLEKRSFGADMNISDLFIMNYLDMFKNDNGEYTDLVPIRNVHTGYLDMEWDVTVDRDDKTKQPIWSIQYTDKKLMKTFVGCLIDKRFKGQQEVINNLNNVIEEFKVMIDKELHEIYPEYTDPSSKGYKKYKMFKDILDNMKYDIRFFEKEKDLIEGMYGFIFRKVRPDYLYIYNACADISQVEARAELLRIKKEKLFCVPEMASSFVDMNYKDGTFKPSKRRHNFECASLTKILDQMITYYSNRGNKEFEGYGLDATAKRETRFGKQDYSHITNDMTNLHHKDFKIALFYAIRDTLLQMFIDVVTDDTTSTLTKKYIVRTEFDRMYIPMVSVSNVFFHLVKRNGYILCNDINKYLKKLEKEKIEKIKDIEEKVYRVIQALNEGASVSGGLCSDPNKFRAEGKELIPGIKNHKVLGTTADADATSMYPNNIITGNISKTALFGKITKVGDINIVSDTKFEELLEENNIDEDELEDEEIINVDDEPVSKTKGQDIALSLINRNAIDIGYHLFNLPRRDEILDAVFPNERKISHVNKHEDIQVEIKNHHLFKLLALLDRSKINNKDKEAGDDASARSFVISSKPITEMSYNKTLYRYYLKSGKSIMESLCDTIYDKDTLYVVAKCGYTNEDSYNKMAKPAKSFNESDYNKELERDLTPEEVKRILKSSNTITSIRLTDTLTLDTFDRLTPLFGDKVHLTVYSSEYGKDIKYVKLYQEVEFKGDVLCIEQIVCVIDYNG